MSTQSELGFVYSSPRSGSTWLTRCINRHPQLVGTELRLFGEFCELWRDPSGSQVPRQTVDNFVRYFINHFATTFAEADRDQMRKDLIRRSIETYVQFALDTAQKKFCIDKITPYLGTAKMVLQRIEDYCGAAKIVHLVRDGRDVLVSGAFDTRTRQGRLDEALFDEQILQDWARYWIEPQRAMRDLSSSTLSTLTIRYEDLLKCASVELQKVFEFFEVDHDNKLCSEIAEMESFERLTNRKAGEAVAHAKARSGTSGGWRNQLPKREALAFRDLTQHWLHEYGYADSLNWVDECS